MMNKTDRNKNKTKNPGLGALSFHEDMRYGQTGRVPHRNCWREVSAYLVLQTSFEIAHKISRFIALKFSVLHWFATQIVIHLDSEDGSCCAFILGALPS
jgi:hypothetical protein